MITHQNKKIIELENEVTDLKTRVQLQERYSSKDCLTFYNFPVNTSSPILSEHMCEAIKRYFQYSLEPTDFKACHVLPAKHGKNVPIIIKFIYFADKDEIFNRRKQLAVCKNLGKALYVSERLSKSDLEIKQKCNELGLVTTTKNSAVKVFFKNPDGGLYSQEMNSVKAVEQLAGRAIKKRPKVQFSFNDEPMPGESVTNEEIPVTKKINNSTTPPMNELANGT